MFIAGHLGVGWSMLRGFRSYATRPRMAAALMGTLLPDLIDKALYYGELTLTGNSEIFYGTRTLGHSLLGLALGLWAARAWRSPSLTWMIAGAGTHLVLDHTLDWISGVVFQIPGVDPNWGLGSARLRGLLFPIYGWSFPRPGFRSMEEHARNLEKPHVIVAEILGCVGLWIARRDWRKIKSE